MRPVAQLTVGSYSQAFERPGVVLRLIPRLPRWARCRTVRDRGCRFGPPDRRASRLRRAVAGWPNKTTLERGDRWSLGRVPAACRQLPPPRPRRCAIPAASCRTRPGSFLTWRTAVTPIWSWYLHSRVGQRPRLGIRFCPRGLLARTPVGDRNGGRRTTPAPWGWVRAAGPPPPA